jgi:D-sedoheptulose 7-phosphate isomerase
MAGLCDVRFGVHAVGTFEIQELHLPIYHCLCAMLEERFFP